MNKKNDEWWKTNVCVFSFSFVYLEIQLICSSIRSFVPMWSRQKCCVLCFQSWTPLAKWKRSLNCANFIFKLLIAASSLFRLFFLQSSFILKMEFNPKCSSWTKFWNAYKLKVEKTVNVYQIPLWITLNFIRIWRINFV